ncbi:hypothetical protein PUNSTDRAFT_146855 [Punctularia strigosozonata HHB-11173 SS5]|uniref:RING-type domain-containing protein n=1 Tax=Punctularia strigosozonata (strain HHB-11173) TaxID=741275 RepID=R7S1Z7_PUNST|nr:uncharacterized protein PUNSTDRAFT_146855 [Punctularia strigosozonata HHB-11173 SS5]EIN03889.1 hypothetical protein PUNSTDRAFT_146855 [Punctularia strigosozonata HHB-11173 SS5]
MTQDVDVVTIALVGGFLDWAAIAIALWILADVSLPAVDTPPATTTTTTTTTSLRERDLSTTALRSSIPALEAQLAAIRAEAEILRAEVRRHESLAARWKRVALQTERDWRETERRRLGGLGERSSGAGGGGGGGEPSRQNAPGTDIAGPSGLATCAICERMVYPPLAVADCGHGFCPECVEIWSKPIGGGGGGGEDDKSGPQPGRRMRWLQCKLCSPEPEPGSSSRRVSGVRGAVGGLAGFLSRVLSSPAGRGT